VLWTREFKVRFFFFIILEGNNEFSCLLQGAIVRGDLNSITVAVQNGKKKILRQKKKQKEKNTRANQAVNKKLKDMNKNRDWSVSNIYFFSGQQRTIIHWQAWELLPAHVYTIQLKPPPILDIIGHNKISGGPKKCFLNVFQHLKKDNIPFIAFMVLQGENKRWFWLAQHIKACIKTKIETQKKNSSPQGLTYAPSQIKKKLNKDDIYRERWKFISIKFVHLLQCRLNMLQEGWIEISQRNKNTPNFCFSKNHKITWRTNRIFKPTKTGGTR